MTLAPSPAPTSTPTLAPSATFAPSLAPTTTPAPSTGCDCPRKLVVVVYTDHYPGETTWRLTAKKTAKAAKDTRKHNRHSLKTSYLAKVFGPLIGYAEYEVFQFVYDLHMWTMLGAKKNAVREVPMRLLVQGAPFSPEYWKTRHAGLVDMQRQLGFPTLFFTISPYEWSFPYHVWLQEL